MKLIRSSLIEDALFKRGFLIKTKNDGYGFSQGSHRSDINAVKMILNDLNIIHEWNEETLLLIEDITHKQYADILLYPARNEEAHTSMAYGSWRNFTRRKHGPKVSTITLEAGVAILVKALSAVGLSTVSSCDGHGFSKPKVEFASFHNGVWFEYIMSEYFQNLSLNFEWKIEINPNNIAQLSATGHKYNILLMQEDSSNMADVLLNHDEELRKLKTQYFGKNKKPTKRELAGKDYEETKKIINQIISQNAFVL